MKVVVSAQGNGLEAQLDQRFGRAKYFVCFDLDTEAVTTVENRAGQDATQGAGISAAQSAAKLGAETVITGHVGPKAFKTLTAAGIKVRLCAEPGTVKEAIERFRRNELELLNDADVEGHW